MRIFERLSVYKPENYVVIPFYILIPHNQGVSRSSKVGKVIYSQEISKKAKKCQLTVRKDGIFLGGVTDF